jgi:hypothetical protein
LINLGKTLTTNDTYKQALKGNPGDLGQPESVREALRPKTLWCADGSFQYTDKSTKGSLGVCMIPTNTTGANVYNYMSGIVNYENSAIKDYKKDPKSTLPDWRWTDNTAGNQGPILFGENGGALGYNVMDANKGGLAMTWDTQGNIKAWNNMNVTGNANITGNALVQGNMNVKNRVYAATDDAGFYGLVVKNPNGSATHLGHGGDLANRNYIRGVHTQIDTPITVAGGVNTRDRVYMATDDAGYHGLVVKNPNGSATHFGHGGDLANRNYIRGTHTQIDTNVTIAGSLQIGDWKIYQDGDLLRFEKPGSTSYFMGTMGGDYWVNWTRK